MTKTRLIEKTDRYTIYEADYHGITQIFRHWKDDTVEIKFTENFAQANGFKDIQDMLNQNNGMRETLLQACGQIPEWINIGNDGSFRVKRTMNNQNYN